MDDRHEPASIAASISLAAPPVLLNPAPDSISIIALPNALATGWVEYGPTDTLGHRCDGASRGQLPLSDRLLTFRLTNLKPGQRYFYRVHLKPIHYTTAYSSSSRGDPFRHPHLPHPHPAAESATFTVWNDTHEQTPTLKQLAANLIANPTDFLLWNGDITNNVSDESKIIPQFFARPINPSRPMYRCFSPAATTMFAAAMRGSWPSTSPAPRANIIIPSATAPWRPSFSMPVRTNPTTSPSMPASTVSTPTAHFQRTFLEKAIVDPAFTAAPFRVVFVHMPLFWDAEILAHWPGVWGQRSQWKMINGWICEDARAKWHDLLVKGKIDLVISGHDHKSVYFPPNAEHPYGQLIGGGPELAAARSIVGSVTATEMKIVVNDLDGRPVIRQSFKRQD